MPTIFLSGAVGAVLAALSLTNGASIWTALAVYALTGAAIALSALLGALLALALETRPAPARAPRTGAGRGAQTRGISHTVS